MAHPLPPKFPIRLLEAFCRPDLFPFIEGDLREHYERNVQKVGTRKAKRRLYKDILFLFRPGMMKTLHQLTDLINTGMLQNYLKVSWRNLVRQRRYSLINLAGLSLGLCCFLLIYLFVNHERSYDRFYENAEGIYRVYEHASGDEYLGSDLYAVTPAQLASTLTQDYPEVRHATTLRKASLLLGTDQTGYFMEDGLWVDTSFFQVFSHPTFLQGSAAKALAHPQSIVLTVSLAEKFGNPYTLVGQSITVDEEPYLVSGIVEDVPANSTFQFGYLINLQSHQGYLNEFKKERWDGSNYQTYFTVNQKAQVAALEAKMDHLISTHWTEDRSDIAYYFQPLTDIHMRADMNNDFGGKGNPQQISIFQAIALLILALACFNYMNLSIARSMHRAREIGLRKTIGARRQQLIVQFLLESLLLTLVALVVALVAVSLGLPEFGRLLSRELSLTEILKPNLLFTLLAVVLGLGLLSGSYPALVLSSFSPIKGVKTTASGVRTSRGQRAIIVGQYAISMIMVTGTLIMYQQFQFIRHRDLGFAKDQIVTLEVEDSEIRDHFEVIKNEWLSHPNVLGVGCSQNLPHEVRSATVINDDPGGSPDDDLPIYRLRTDTDFLAVYDLQLIAGRLLPPSSPATDSLGYCLINQTAAAALGFSPEEAIGQPLTDNYPQNYRTIIGVVRDFHLHSMHLPISPVLIETRPYFQYISVQIGPENMAETMKFLTRSLGAYSHYPVEFQYMDQRLAALYYTDTQEANLFHTFSSWALLIASLGLFGLAALNAQQREKEIGIRKVLGASVASLLTLITGSFLRLVLLGFLLSVPVAWLLMQRWLEEYAYRVDIKGWFFVAAGVFAAVVALLTVGSQSLKAALVNPTECLKNE